MSTATEDVVILGGGLAGLTLALQLRQSLPKASIAVLEKSRHPAPAATHKVGESSVEIAANYFDAVLGLGEHLAGHQLNKFGFRFFFSDGSADIAAVTELGASRYLTTPSYQIDRGIFENFLAKRAAECGITFKDGCSVLGLSGGGATPHRVEYSRHGGAPAALSSRWLVDASGRAGLLKRKFGLAEPSPHDANAVWFRVGARVEIDEWSSDAPWRSRCTPPARWLSTNHLVGDGYWVWLIPLSSGSHSVGIVADHRKHPLAQMNSFERAMAWLHNHQPRLAEDLEGKRHLLQDFRAFRGFSYGCRQLFSADRWAITGEAGVFLDPFYSPGGDFIAIGNTYITDLIERDFAGEPYEPRAAMYEQLFQSLYESMLTLYRDQYEIFGNPRVLPVKVMWDYTYYWGTLCQIFFQRRLTDLSSLTLLRPELTGAVSLNAVMQDFLRAWSSRSRRENTGVMLDQASLAWFAELNRGLRDPLDDDGFSQRIRQCSAQLAELARQIIRGAEAECPGIDASAVRALLGSGATGVSESLLFKVT